MKRSTGKILAVCIALLLGVAAIGSFYYRRLARSGDGRLISSAPWCRQEEDCIAEAVYQYEIQNSEGHKSSDLFFLSVNQGHDPESEILKRLARSSYRVKPISHSIDQRTVIKDNETGEPGVILTLGKITWVDKTRVEVALSAYSGFGDAKGYVYELVRGENGWMIRNRKFGYET